MLLLLFIAWKQYVFDPLAATRPESEILIMANDKELKKDNKNRRYSTI
jgi:hypothetical protein